MQSEMIFENYVVGEENMLAYEAAIRFTDLSLSFYNPVIVIGPIGAGKTHLLTATYNRMKAICEAEKVHYVQAEFLFYEFIDALRTKDTLELRARYIEYECLFIDNIEFLDGKSSSTEWLINIVNIICSEGGRVMFSSMDRHSSSQNDFKSHICSNLLEVSVNSNSNLIYLEAIKIWAKDIDVSQEELKNIVALGFTSIAELKVFWNRLEFECLVKKKWPNFEVIKALMQNDDMD